MGEQLIVAPFTPLPADFGGAIRMLEIVKHLASKGPTILLAPAAGSDFDAWQPLSKICDVTLVPTSWSLRQPATWRKRLAQVRHLHGDVALSELAVQQSNLQAVMDRLFMTRSIELVLYALPQMATLRPLRSCPTILDNQNIEHELLARIATASDGPRRVFNSRETDKVKALEERVWRAVDVNLATSARDAAIISAVTGNAVPVVPNGVTLKPIARNPIPRRLLFIGALRHQPNVDGMRWYLEHVHPLVIAQMPDVTLDVVGADPPQDLVNDPPSGVTFHGRVEDVAPFLSTAAAEIVPLRSGGGTRLKVLEAFASRVPVVSTTIGVEGIDAQANEHLLIADEPAAFAEAVAQALTRQPAAMIESAHALVASRYGWQSSVMPQLDEAIALAHTRFTTRT